MTVVPSKAPEERQGKLNAPTDGGYCVEGCVGQSVCACVFKPASVLYCMPVGG